MKYMQKYQIQYNKNKHWKSTRIVMWPRTRKGLHYPLQKSDNSFEDKKY